MSWLLDVNARMLTTEVLDSRGGPLHSSPNHEDSGRGLGGEQRPAAEQAPVPKGCPQHATCVVGSAAADHVLPHAGYTMKVCGFMAPGSRYSISTRVIRMRQKSGSCVPLQYSVRKGI